MFLLRILYWSQPIMTPLHTVQSQLDTSNNTSHANLIESFIQHEALFMRKMLKEFFIQQKHPSLNWLTLSFDVFIKIYLIVLILFSAKTVQDARLTTELKNKFKNKLELRFGNHMKVFQVEAWLSWLELVISFCVTYTTQTTPCWTNDDLGFNVIG